MSKYSNKYVLETGIGLQDVDGLKNSEYFLNESKDYISGKITLEELDHIISSYYENKQSINEKCEEADKVSIRIAKIISEDSFTFTVGQFLSIHKSLFDGIIPSAGKMRDYNFSKEEWVLDGASVTYGDYRELENTLNYDFSQEKLFNYKNLSIDDVIDHLARFVANLWQIHVFEEGNTRTTAVFFIKYLRSLGFDVTNDAFAKGAWYFRNALVRANYTNIVKGVYEDRTFLIMFLRNLILGEDNILKNRDLHITSNNVTYTKREEKVINLLVNNPKIKIEEIANAVSVSPRTIKTLLSNLIQKGKIERINGKRYGSWKVNL